MVELADTLDLGSGGEIRESSNLSEGTQLSIGNWKGVDENFLCQAFAYAVYQVLNLKSHLCKSGCGEWSVTQVWFKRTDC